MKVLITGGGGFIGAHIGAYYLRQGKEVIIVDSFSRAGSEENLRWLQKLQGKLKVLCEDITRPSSKLFSAVESSDLLFHMAAQVAVTTSLENPRRDFETNVLGTFELLEATRVSKKKPLFLFASTNKVYGKMEGMKIKEKAKRYACQNYPFGIDESQPLDFYSPYGCSKGAADQYVRDYSRSYGLRTVVFRQSCIYGEHQFGIEDQGWVAWFCIAALLGYPVTIYGTGKQVRDVLYIEDLLSCFIRAVRNIHKTAGQVYNVGGGPENTLSLLELVDILEKEAGKKMELRFAPERTGDQRVYVSDIRKAWNEFGWKPRVHPSEGIKKMLAWVRKNRDKIGSLALHK